MELGQNCHECPSEGEWERCDQELARPVLLPVPPQRSLLRHEHIIARQLTQSAPSRTAIWLDPPALVRLLAEPGLRLAPRAKFWRLHSQSDRDRRRAAVETAPG